MTSPDYHSMILTARTRQEAALYIRAWAYAAPAPEFIGPSPDYRAIATVLEIGWGDDCPPDHWRTFLANAGFPVRAPAPEPNPESAMDPSIGHGPAQGAMPPRHRGYWAHDGIEYEYFDTAKEARSSALQAIENHRSSIDCDGWPSAMHDVMWGTVAERMSDGPQSSVDDDYHLVAPETSIGHDPLLRST